MFKLGHGRQPAMDCHGPETVRRTSFICVRAMVVWVAATITFTASAQADPLDDPPDNDVIRPLPAITVTRSNWVPKFPFPYDQTRASVTDTDITAEREMCQWFTAQYETLRRQIDRVQFNRMTPNGPGVISGGSSDWDYSINGLQRQVDIVTGNIDQAEQFLAPRVQALTQSTDSAGDSYFPIYQGKSFFLLWQHLSNVNAGIKSHQPDWVTGPSILRVKRWGTSISRSHVCD